MLNKRRDCVTKFEEKHIVHTTFINLLVLAPMIIMEFNYYCVYVLF